MPHPSPDPHRLQRLVETLARTAADLTRARGTEDVLALICSRTRLLVDSDMAYISLNDVSRGETYIRATDGVRTEEYRSIRMPLGTGVLGAAAGGSRTFKTSDHTGDGALIHIPEVDAAVELEGVRSILASPLRIDGSVIGALLIADRISRDYGEEEQLILESLAPQAAVAVENARLFEAQRLALESERIARDEASRRLAQVQRLAQAEQAFSMALSETIGVDALVAQLRRVLRREVAAFDASGSLLAGTIGDFDSAAQRR